MRQVANLPHVKAEFKQRNKSATQSGLFMLDSGAGGVDAMFHVRACKEYDLIDNKSNNFRFIKVPNCLGFDGEQPRRWSQADRECCLQGVGGEEMTSIRVQSGELHWMELSSNRLERIRSLFGGRGGLDLVKARERYHNPYPSISPRMAPMLKLLTRFRLAVAVHVWPHMCRPHGPDACYCGLSSLPYCLPGSEIFKQKWDIGMKAL